MKSRALAAALLAALALTATAEDDQTPRGLAALKLPPGFRAEIAAGPELTQYPVFMAYDERGRLFVGESSGKNVKAKELLSDPQGSVLLLTDTDGDGRFDTKTVFADKLGLPMGVEWLNGSLYVADPPNFYKFTDGDGDGVAEQREVLLSGWNVLNTASLHGPYFSPDGHMYLTHGRHGYKIATKEGTTLEGGTSHVWRCLPDGTKLERVCGGAFDNPVELIFEDSGETIGTMTYFTDPRNGQRDALMHWVEGGVYPKPHEANKDMIRTGDLMPTMTKFARIAPAGLHRYRGANFGAEYKDNLFSAQFNPHRVQRHVVFRDAGSFRTEDSDFLTSDDPDFHPTDVLEDADGSLLVTDTGAWYVDACPLSRIAKPELKGSIFRIVREDGAKPEDPRGAKLDWKRASAKELAARLADARPAVRVQAREALVMAGHGAARATEKVLRESADASVAAEALWVLHRIGGQQNAIRAALTSRHVDVRIAAARAIGLAQDLEARPLLEQALADADLGVRRQAATALGQLADRSAAPALLAASAGNKDRFVEHAIIFSLIQLANEDALAGALRADDPATRKAALIALDQLKSAKLTTEAFAPFLAEQDDAVRRAVLWIASRHPEWSGAVVGEIDTRLRAADFDAANAGGLRELILAYAASPELQSLLTAQLGDAQLDDTRKLFLLDNIGLARVNPLPDAWIARLGELLAAGSTEVRGRVAYLLRTRGIGNFDGQLLSLAADAAQPLGMRLTALSAAVPRVKALDATQFAFVSAAIAGENAPTDRQAAAKILADAELTGAQLRAAAEKLLPGADALTFPSLLDAFGKSTDESVGRALVAGLGKAGDMLERLPSQRLDSVLAAYPAAVQEAAKPLRAKAEADREVRIAKLKGIEPLLGAGDVARGRAVFFGQKVACFTCHRVGEEGGVLGPDLTSVGAIRSTHDILEAILFPSASTVQDYDNYLVETPDATYQGTIARQEPDAITLRTAVNEEVRVPRADIQSMSVFPISKMPEGLDQGLTQTELVDLMAFMKSLNGEQWLQPEKRETKKK